MNKFLFTLIFTLVPSLIWSCSKSDDSPEPPVNSDVAITVNPQSLSTGCDAANMEISVTSTADWSIASDESWCVVTPTGGSKGQTTKVTVKISANTGSTSRTCSLTIKSSGKTATVAVSQTAAPTLNVSASSVSFGAQESTATVTIESNEQWTAESSDSWCTVTPTSGGEGNTTLTIKAEANATDEARSTSVTVKSASMTKTITVDQYTDEIKAPEGYSLVWHDEFNEGTLPGPDWVLENWHAGYVNNELQIYTSNPVDGKRTAEVKDGFLWINCFRANDGKVYSARMNAKPNTGWLYGYFEARINLPKGKGTWPAYWMMPCNVDWNTNGWPHCGEIDIMEEVGADPNEVSSSLHTGKYNHTINTQKTAKRYLAGAEGEFHIYALEWSEDGITTYVDGEVLLKVSKAQMGADHESWPFHYAFYPILNLAWGGDWGGYKGVDDNALPVSMKVDYVRIFQKNK